MDDNLTMGGFELSGQGLSMEMIPQIIAAVIIGSVAYITIRMIVRTAGQSHKKKSAKVSSRRDI